ncbi:unnamed protein product [Absidia cylindrospora]
MSSEGLVILEWDLLLNLEGFEKGKTNIMGKPFHLDLGFSTLQRMTKVYMVVTWIYLDIKLTGWQHAFWCGIMTYRGAQMFFHSGMNCWWDLIDGQSDYVFGMGSFPFAKRYFIYTYASSSLIQYDLYGSSHM